MSWNRVHRPKQVAQLHSERVRRALQQFLDQGKIPQALLFTGPKGTGKTSASRIIGAILNDPQNAEHVEAVYFAGSDTKSKFREPQLDAPLAEAIFSGNSFVVQELDAASNRGIDDIRQLKERVQLPPQQGKMAVYILDEVHMLTTEAFNALLKLLEEPPQHVVFVLATTELHKIPETIISRCQMVQFAKATEAELIKALQGIAEKEGVTASDDALQLIANRADGSFRDAVKLFEQCAATGSVTAEVVTAALQDSTPQLVPELVRAILAKDPGLIIPIFQRARSEGVQPKFFHTHLLGYLHTILLQNLKLVPGTPETTQQAAQFLLQELAPAALSAPSPIPLLQLELKLLELVFRAQKSPAPSSGTQNKQPTPSDSSRSSPPAPTVKASTRKESVALTGPVGDGKELCARWHDFVDQVAQKNSTVAALLRSAKPVLGEPGSARVQVFYRFHQEQLMQPKFAQLTHDCASAIAAGSVQLQFEVVSTPDASEVADTVVAPALEKLAVEALM